MNKKIIALILTICIVFTISISAFASTNDYGSFKYYGDANANSSISYLIQKFFGRANLPKNGTGSTCMFNGIYNVYGYTSSAPTKQSDFLEYLSNNSVMLIVDAISSINTTYFVSDSLNNANTVHWQLSFSANFQVSEISFNTSSTVNGGNFPSASKILFDYNPADNTWSKINGSAYNASVEQNGSVYVVDFEYQASSGTYRSIGFNIYGRQNDQSSGSLPTNCYVQFDNSFTPYWDKTVNNTPTINITNVQQPTDISGVLSYLNLITQLINLETDQVSLIIDYLGLAMDWYEDIYTVLNTILSTEQTISGNTASMLSNLQQCSALAGSIYSYLSNDQYDLLDSIDDRVRIADVYLQNTINRLDTIISKMDSIIASLESIDSKFNKWLEDSEFSDGMWYKGFAGYVWARIKSIWQLTWTFIGTSFSSSINNLITAYNNFDGSVFFGSS